MNATTLGEMRDGVGESPFWDAEAEAVWSVDITGGRILRRDWPSGATTAWRTDDLPTALARRRAGGAIVSFARGVALWTPEDGTTERIVVPEPDVSMRLNEGACDPSGRFWVASMDDNLTDALEPREQGPARGRLFRLDGASATAVDAPALGIPNTMAWSPDGTRFYFGDSLRNVVWTYDRDPASGEIAGRRVFVEGGPGVPDGSCVDAEGCVWTARFGAARVVRYDPDGRVEREVRLPVTNPTAATFGGPDLRTLLVTSARFGMTIPEPIEGAMLAVPTDVRGQAENWYAA